MNNKNMDMVNGPLFKNILIFAFPLMLTNLLQMFFNAADTIIVGRFAGQQALAAVGATNSLIFLFNSLFNGLSTGTNVVVAREIGSGKTDNISKSVETSVLMGIISGTILMIAGFFFSKPMLGVLSTPKDIIDASATYMRIYFLSGIFMNTYNFGSAVLRAKGDTKRPLYFLAISGVINVVLNVIFVVVFKMSVSGVALATVISQAVSCILVLMSLISTDDSTHLNIRNMKFDSAVSKEILKIGIPAGIQSMSFSLTNVVVQSSINSFDSSVIVAGNTAAANIENFIYVGMMAFSNATITFTSQCVGAGRKDRIMPVFYITMLLDCLSAFLVGGICYLNGRVLLSLYTEGAEAINAGMLRLFWIGMFLIINGAIDVYSGSLRGLGQSVLPTAIMLIGIIGVRLLWLWFYFPLHRSLDVIYMCFPLSWSVTLIIDMIAFAIVYKKIKV